MVASIVRLAFGSRSEHVAHLSDPVGEGRAPTVLRGRSVRSSTSIAAAVTSTDGEVSASITTSRGIGADQGADRSRTKSALPKNSGPSTRTTSTPGLRAAHVRVLFGVDPLEPGPVGRRGRGPRRVAARCGREQDQRHHDADDQAGQGVEDEHAEHGRDGRDEVGPAGELVDRGRAARSARARAGAARRRPRAR